MENQEETEIVITEKNDPDAEIVLLEDIEVVIDKDNDPEKVTVVRQDPRCKTTSEGDEVVGEGNSIIKPDLKSKEKGQRGWFNFGRK